MATPASQTTTPSPQLSALSHLTLDAPVTSHSLKRSLSDAQHDSPPDLDAFLKRAHYGKLARELRARLSYASFKTSHNVSQVPLPTLEQQYASKPRPPSTVQQALSPRQRLTHAQMMPPPTTSSPRGSQSLYSALLGSAPMPPTKRAKHAPSPNRRHHHQRSHSSPFLDPNGGRSIHSFRLGGGNNAEPDDINAAATLTALLLNRPGSRSEGSTLSRSSSSASVTAVAQSQPSQLSQGSSSSFYGSSQPAADPSSSQQSRPKTPQPDDKQAAELMLFLATSPSPARSTHSRTRSESRPGQLLSKARVLFGSNDSSSGAAPGPRGTPASTDTGGRLGPPMNSTASTFVSPQLLPPPFSPKAGQSSNKSTFDIAEYIYTSPFPSQSQSRTSKASLRGAEGRRLFGEDDGPVASGSGSGGGSSSRSRGGGSNTVMFPTSGSGSSSTQGDKSMIGVGTSVLGPAMGANA